MSECIHGVGLCTGSCEPTAPASARSAAEEEAREIAREICDDVMGYNPHSSGEGNDVCGDCRQIAARLAPILAERDALRERAEKAEVDEVLAEMRAKALETNLGIARQRCDAAEAALREWERWAQIKGHTMKRQWLAEAKRKTRDVLHAAAAAKRDGKGEA